MFTKITSKNTQKIIDFTVFQPIFTVFQLIFYCVSTHILRSFLSTFYTTRRVVVQIFIMKTPKIVDFWCFAVFGLFLWKNTNAVSLFENRVFWSFLAIFDKIVIFHNFYHEKHRKNGGCFLHTFWVFDGFYRFYDFGTFYRFGRFWHFWRFWRFWPKFCVIFTIKWADTYLFYTVFIKKEPQNGLKTQ